MALFLNLYDIAVNKDALARKNTEGKWTYRTYSTKLGEGIMVYAPQTVYPEPLKLKLNLSGMHRIYLGILNFNRDNYGHIKLTDDKYYTGIKPSPHGNPRNWSDTEFAEEVYWKCADLTNQDIIIEKEHHPFDNVPAFLWIRCEKMTVEEIALHEEIIANKKPVIQAHIDIDPLTEFQLKTPDDLNIKLDAIKNANIDFCIVETWAHRDMVDNGEDYIPNSSYYSRKWQGSKWDFETLYAPQLKFAKENGLTLYAATRMSPGLFWGAFHGNKNFFYDHNEFYCVNRDGTSPKICSYAYPEVREYMIEDILFSSKGFSGVSLIFIRGMHIGFEKPVTDRFKSLYPGIDPFTLPMSDPRLHGVFCSFMNEFMRELRARLPEGMKINVLTDYSLATSKYMGLDVEAWAKEGLIDSASQCDMETYEDLDGCMDGDVIDLSKYKEKILDHAVIRRRFATNPHLVYPHIAEYAALRENYGIEVYHVLPWVHTVPMTKYHEIVEEMKKLGAKKFIAWNTNHVVYNLPELHYILSIGDEKKEDIVESRYIRMLSFEDGGSTTHHLSSWKG
ncbi:MAG: hypothetical protein IJD97_05270 [Clostridia bacterium]|nr:hypothetical protein [Clostridia bacterium]